MDVPQIDAQWVRRWCWEHSISLRKPNKRLKCSWSVLCQRMGFMWLNIIRVQALAALLHERRMEFFCADQKPLHMNEAGSRQTGSFDIGGTEQVKIRACHAASRSRVSLMTTTAGSPPFYTQG